MHIFVHTVREILPESPLLSSRRQHTSFFLSVPLREALHLHQEVLPPAIKTALIRAKIAKFAT